MLDNFSTPITRLVHILRLDKFIWYTEALRLSQLTKATLTHTTCSHIY